MWGDGGIVGFACVLSCVWLFCDPFGCSLPGSSVHGIFQARILERVAMPFSRGSSLPRDRPWVSCIAVRFFTIWATREAQVKMCVCVCVCVFSYLVASEFLRPIMACQVPLSMEFSRQEYWSGLPYLSPEDLHDLEIEFRSPALQSDSLPTERPGKPTTTNRKSNIGETVNFLGRALFAV